MLRDLPVREVMVTDVVSFVPEDNVRDAMTRLVEAGVDAGPVVDATGAVVGMLSTGDLIVEEARLHFPTVVNFLGVNVTIPWNDRELDASVAKALGATVGEVMSDKVVTCRPDDTVEDAATLMHDKHVSRLPVVDAAGSLVGIIARGDIVRAIVEGRGESDPGDSED